MSSRVSRIFAAVFIASFCNAFLFATIPTPTKPSVITTGRAEPMPVAFVYSGAIGSDVWTQSHESARKKLETEFGKRIQAVAIENVSTADEAARVFRELAAKGYKVVFATHPVQQAAAMRMAEADYDVKIEQAMGERTRLNVRTYSARFAEQAYLGGIVAAGASKTSQLGFMVDAASMIGRNEVRAFELGVRAVSPRAKLQILWTDSRTNPQANADAVLTLSKAGVDTIVVSQNTEAVLRKVPPKIGLVGLHAHPKEKVPSNYIATVALNWTPFYKTAIKESFDYLCTKTDTSRGYREGAIEVVGLSRTLSIAAQKKLAMTRQRLMNGSATEIDEVMSNTSSGATERQTKGNDVRLQTPGNAQPTNAVSKAK
jgi:basic membrane protein A and related proteins